MAKTAIYYEEAKRLYVNEGFAIDTIVGMLGNKVSRKTLYNWKKKGEWDRKRKEFLKQTKDLQEELLELARLTLKEAKANPTPKNILAMGRALAALRTYQGVKLLEEETTEEDRQGLTEADVKKIEKEVLGLE